MNGNDFIPLLGLTSDDEKVRAFLASCGIAKQPKLKRGDVDAYLESEKLGIELTFTDERHLDVRSRDYEEGALVLSNISMYGDGCSPFKRFQGQLPHGLEFEFGMKEATAKLRKEPQYVNKGQGLARWDLKGYCLFLTFDEDFKEISNIAIQLPLA